jgi:uncharacterized repeat protein (TIGR01451 family)
MPRIALPLCLIACSAVPAANADVVVQYSETLRDYRLAARLDSDPAEPRVPGAVVLHFDALGQAFALALEPNARLDPMLATLGRPDGVIAYRGELAGKPGSWARIVMTPDGPSGLIADGVEFYALEARRDGSGGTASVIYRLSDVYVEPGTLECAAADMDGTDAASALAIMAEEFEPLAAQGATLNLDIGVVADFEFSNLFGTNTEAELLTRFNTVDGIFSEQIGVQITVAEVDVFRNADDPFTTSNADNLLREVSDYRSETPAQYAQGITHLFTGRNLDGTTAGIAYLGSLCSRRFGAGLSEGSRNTTVNSLVAAHEIGHNFGAPHDGEGACASTGSGFLMAASINGSRQFSECSIEQMQPEIASAACLRPLATPNLAIDTPERGRTLPSGAAFDYRLTVSNVGLDPAAASTATVTIENGLEVLSATAGCAVVNQTATCDLGAIAGGSAREITLNLRGNTPGTFDIDATASSASDNTPGNNTLADAITIVPAVDLAITASPGSVQVNQQIAFAASIANTADLVANGVVVTATLSAGLRAEQATLAGTACTVTGQSVACAPSALAARDSFPLALTLTGTQVGAQQVSVAATANETERNAADNNLAVGVDVTAPPSAEGGGGGATSWLAVLALGLLGAACPAGRPTAAR